MKKQGNLTNIMGSLGHLWEYFDDLMQNDRGVIDLELVMKLV